MYTSIYTFPLKKKTIKILNEIKKMGLRLSIDDFGTGYSSLEHLKRMPMDALKIDISFIRNITDNDDDKKIVETIINIAHGFNCEVVAEGVETVDQLDLLRKLDCEIIQGYLFSKPVCADKLQHEYSKSLKPSIKKEAKQVS